MGLAFGMWRLARFSALSVFALAAHPVVAAETCAFPGLCGKKVDLLHLLTFADGKEARHRATFEVMKDGALAVRTFFNKPAVSICTTQGKKVLRSCPGTACGDFPKDKPGVTHRSTGHSTCQMTRTGDGVDLKLVTLAVTKSRNTFREGNRTLDLTFSMTVDASYQLHLALKDGECSLSGTGSQLQLSEREGSDLKVHPEHWVAPEAKTVEVTFKSLSCLVRD